MSNTSYVCAYHDEVRNISDTDNVSWSSFNKEVSRSLQSLFFKLGLNLTEKELIFKKCVLCEKKISIFCSFLVISILLLISKLEVMVRVTSLQRTSQWLTMQATQL